MPWKAPAGPWLVTTSWVAETIAEALTSSRLAGAAGPWIGATFPVGSSTTEGSSSNSPPVVAIAGAVN